MYTDTRHELYQECSKERKNTSKNIAGAASGQPTREAATTKQSPPWSIDHQGSRSAALTTLASALRAIGGEMAVVAADRARNLFIRAALARARCCNIALLGARA